MRRAVAIGLGAALVAGAGAIAARAQSSPDIAEQQRRLASARAQSAAADRRAQALEADAAREKDAEAKARAEEAAVAAHVQQAEADMAAAHARIALLAQAQAEQRTRLAARQGPMVRLVAALQSMARRPAVVAVLQPGSVDDMVHARAVLASVTPAIAARTADVRADIDRSRRLESDAALALQALARSRTLLDQQHLELARLEAEHRLRSVSAGADAMVESDRAIALGEQARDIVDLVNRLGDASTTREALASLPGPLPRPARPGEVPSPSDTLPWSHANPPYRLPVVGRVTTGLGELSDSGYRSRGLTLEVAPGAQVVAPTRGRVIYAGPFRDFGTIVILDHGNGWTSLIAGLGVLQVKVGNTLEQGAPVGVAGSGEPRITIELRRRGRAVDMTPLLG